MPGLLLVAILAVACSGKVSEESPSDAGAEVGEDVGVDSAVDAPVADTEEDCARAVDAITSSFGGQYCTTTVRISQVDFSVLGWQAFCGKFSGTLTSEADARAALASYPKFVGIDTFTVQQAGTRDVPWIFFHAPGDFGGVGTVDARTGLATYYANLSWSALGDVKLPTASPPAPLVCNHAPLMYSLAGDARPATDAQAMATLLRTPILRALERTHVIASTQLLHVALDGSISDPGYKPKNEWVAMIESALLE